MQPSTNGTALSLQQILAAQDQPVAVDVPQWGGPVYIRPLTGAQWAEMEQMNKAEMQGDWRSQLVAWALCDSDGKPMGATVEQLSGCNAMALDLVATEVLKITTPDQQELEKN